MFKNLLIISLMAILPSSALEYGFSLSGSAYIGHGKIIENFDIPDLSGFEISLWSKQQKIDSKFSHTFSFVFGQLGGEKEYLNKNIGLDLTIYPFMLGYKAQYNYTKQVGFYGEILGGISYGEVKVDWPSPFGPGFEENRYKAAMGTFEFGAGISIRLDEDVRLNVGYSMYKFEYCQPFNGVKIGLSLSF